MWDLKRWYVCLLSLPLLLGAATEVKAGFILYGADRTTGDLFSIDTASAATIRIGNVGSDALGLAYDSTNDVMYLNMAFSLSRVSTLTGILQLVGTHSPDATGIAFGGSQGSLFTSRNNDIYSMDPLTGATSLLGPSGLSNAGITSFASDSAGNVYFSQSVSFTDPLNGSIYQLNTTTGAASLLFADVSNGDGLDSIAFDDQGNLYGVTALHDRLIRIDLQTGSSTVVGVLPYNGVQSLSFGRPTDSSLPPATAVPEPSTLTLLVSGIAGLFPYWRCRGRIRRQAPNHPLQM